jgi:hypothetical protein
MTWPRSGKGPSFKYYGYVHRMPNRRPLSFVGYPAHLDREESVSLLSLRQCELYNKRE